MGCVQFTNFAFTTIATAVDVEDLTIEVNSSGLFPTPIPGPDDDWFYATLVDGTDWAAGTVPPSKYEIVKVTAVSGTTWTVERGVDNTTAQAWCPCDVVALLLNSQALYDLEDCATGGGGEITLFNEGVEVGLITEIDFLGTNVNATISPAGHGLIDITGSSGSVLTVKDEGSTLDTAVTSIDFVGSGVTATNVGHAVTVTIPGGGGSGGSTLQGEEFTSSGTFTPASGVTSVWVTAVGAGGGGGTRLTSALAGGGGGSGEHVVSQPVAVSGAITITIGAGGVGGANDGSAHDGAAGGDTSFGTLVVARGGHPGGGAASGSGGAGGGYRGGATGVGGTSESPTFFGGSGGGTGGGTGAASGTTGAGYGGYPLGGSGGVSNGSQAGGGGGGASMYGLGAAGGAGNVAGITATNPGSGGGGAGAKASGNYAGGDGAPGYLLVQFIAP